MDRRSFDHFLNRGPPDAATASLAGRELPADLVQNVSNITMGQLFYILSHIQKLSAQAPVTAQALLAENPQICYALLHAECLAGMIEEPLLPMTGDELQQAKAKARRMREELENHELPQPAEAAAARAAMVGGVSKYGKVMPPQGLAARPPSGPMVGPRFSKAPGGMPPHLQQPPPPMMGDAACGSGALGPCGGMPFSSFCGGPLPGPPPPPPATAAAAAAPAAAAAAPATGSSCGGAQGAVGSEEDQKQHLMQKLVQLTPEQIARLPEHTKVQLLQFLQQHSQQA